MPAASDSARDAGDLMSLLRASGLALLRLAGRTMLPVVQGGMGIGVSAHRLAGNVAALGGMGTISSVDLRRHHPDLMERTRNLGVGPQAKLRISSWCASGNARSACRMQSCWSTRAMPAGTSALPASRT